MSSDPKAATPSTPKVPPRDKGVRIFTYPKLIFIFPTMIMAIVCCIGMFINGAPDASRGYTKAQNMLALLFLGVFALNILMLTFDFPRFTVVAGGLLGTTLVFFLLWLGMLTDFLTPLVSLLDKLSVSANSGFYLIFALVLILMYAAVLLTRWLDYWEFMPNEILHHHGPWSDLERYPTMNLKFDKEVPDVFEHLLFGAGRLVFHVAGESKAIILDNVLHINKKEEALKQIMSRLEVRITTDQEAAQP